MSTNSIKVKVKKSYCSRQNCYQCFFMRRALWFFVIGLIARDNYCVSILCFSLFQQSSCSSYRLTTIDWQQRFWFNPSKRNFKGKRPCSTDQTVHVHEIVKRVLTEFLPPAVSLKLKWTNPYKGKTINTYRYPGVSQGRKFHVPWATSFAK